MSFLLYHKMIIPHKVLLTTILLSLAASGFCQDKLSSLTASFNQYYDHTSAEQLYVHTDKSFYLAGEIMWFKMYATDINDHKPISISKVAYAEILDTANKPVLQGKIGMKEGTGNGSFYLPLTLNSGNYKFRAYTNWMKNTGPACFFEKVVTVVNVQKTTPQPNVANTAAYDVQFFPEGGNLVAGLESKIAFKVTDNNGTGVQASGYIFDEQDTMVRFATSHAGIGSFQFKPLDKHSYKAAIQIRNGKTIIKELPVAYTAGIVMSVREIADQVQVQVQSVGTNSGVVFLLVHTGAAVEVAKQSTLQNGSAVFTINKASLKEGMSHFTVFGESRRPLCERMYFKRPATDLNIRLLASQSEYEKRSKVNLTLAAPNLKDSASLSMSVYRLDSIQSVDENTISTYLLLSSGLKGYIEDLSYYFNTQNRQVKQDLDNLLLVNGWSRYKWDAVLNNAKPAFTYVPEYNGHIVTGKVVNSITGKPQPDVPAYLSVPGLRTQFVSALSDSGGTVKFELENMYGSSEIVAQTKESDGRYKIQIDDPFSKVYTAIAIPLFSLPAQYPNTLLDQSISMQVQNIYAAGKLNQYNLPVVDTTAFYLQPDSRYNLEDYTRFTTMEEIIREYVSLVNLTRRSGTYHMQVFDKGHNVPFTGDPLILLDGVPMFNFNKFLTVDPLKLKSLEVVQKKYFLGASSFDGILNWKSYAGDYTDVELDPSAVVMDYDGLQVAREFYSPVYEHNTLSHLPDFRNVLYWNPNIQLKGSNEQLINFYTSDLAGKYAVIIQGISSGGLCGSAINTFEVKE